MMTPDGECYNCYFKNKSSLSSRRVPLSSAGVDGWGLMLDSEARASMSPGSTLLSLRRANRSGAAGSGSAALNQLACEIGSCEVLLPAGRRDVTTCRSERVDGESGTAAVERCGCWCRMFQGPQSSE